MFLLFEFEGTFLNKKKIKIGCDIREFDFVIGFLVFEFEEAFFFFN